MVGESKFKEEVYRLQRPYRIAVAIAVVAFIGVVSFKLPWLAGGGIFLPWVIAAVLFVAVLCLRPFLRRWIVRRRQGLN